MNEELERDNPKGPEEPQTVENCTYAYAYQPVRPAQPAEPKRRKGTWVRVLALLL